MSFNQCFARVKPGYGPRPYSPLPEASPDPNLTLTQTLDLTQGRVGTWPATEQRPACVRCGAFWWYHSFPLAAHGGFDFLAARRHYGYGWASVSLFLFVSLFLCTVTTNNRLLPWLEIGMLKLEEEEKYTNTLRRVTKAVKVCCDSWSTRINQREDTALSTGRRLGVLAVLCKLNILTYMRDARIHEGYRRTITSRRRRPRTYVHKTHISFRAPAMLLFCGTHHVSQYIANSSASCFTVRSACTTYTRESDRLNSSAPCALSEPWISALVAAAPQM